MNRVWSTSLSGLLAVVAFGCEEPPKLQDGKAVPSVVPPTGASSLVINKIADPPAVASGGNSGGAAASVDPHADPGGKFPLNDVQLDKLMNPSGATEYSGPTGTIEGTVRVKGDAPALRNFQAMPKGCDKATAVYAPAYRAGPKGELADALVGVLQTNGYVRPPRTDKHVVIKDCAIQPRVVDLSLGQRLLVANADDMPYAPQTAVGKSKITRLALKDQSPVPVILAHPGAYGMTWLAGVLPGGSVPELTVFVIPSALHQTTALDGRYRIVGVPAGKNKVYVTASHQGMPEVRKEVEVVAGGTVTVDLELSYAAPGGSTSTASSGSAAKPPVIK